MDMDNGFEKVGSGIHVGGTGQACEWAKKREEEEKKKPKSIMTGRLGKTLYKRVTKCWHFCQQGPGASLHLGRAHSSLLTKNQT